MAAAQLYHLVQSRQCYNLQLTWNCVYLARARRRDSGDAATTTSDILLEPRELLDEAVIGANRWSHRLYVL